MKEQYWKYSLIILIVGLGILLFRQAQPFMNGILGGFQTISGSMDSHHRNHSFYPDTPLAL